MVTTYVWSLASFHCMRSSEPWGYVEVVEILGAKPPKNGSVAPWAGRRKPGWPPGVLPQRNVWGLLISGWWWLEHEFYEFPFSWEYSSQLTNSYSSEGLKPPTRSRVFTWKWTAHPRILHVREQEQQRRLWRLGGVSLSLAVVDILVNGIS